MQWSMGVFFIAEATVQDGSTCVRPLQLLFDISTGSMARHRWAGITVPRPLELLVDRDAVFIGGVTSLSVALPFL